MAGGQLGVGRDDAELPLLGECPLAQGVPAVVEGARVPVGPLRSDVVRRVRGPRREVGEERLVRQQRLLLADPRDRLVGHVGHEVVALFGRLLGLDRDRALVDRRVVLMGLAADEAVEVLEAAPGGPVVERAHRARLPDRHLVALAELRRRVAVQLQGLRERRAGVRAHRAVAGSRRRELRDAAHADGVVVPAAQESRPRGRAQRSRVEAVVLEARRRQALGVGRIDRAAERARGAEADIIDQDDEDVGSPLRGPQRLDRRERGVRVLRVIGREPDGRDVGNRQYIALRLRPLGHGCLLDSAYRVTLWVGLLHLIAQRERPARVGALGPRDCQRKPAGSSRPSSEQGEGDAPTIRVRRVVERRSAC